MAASDVSLSEHSHICQTVTEVALAWHVRVDSRHQAARARRVSRPGTFVSQ